MHRCMYGKKICLYVGRYLPRSVTRVVNSLTIKLAVKGSDRPMWASLKAPTNKTQIPLKHGVNRCGQDDFS